MNQLPSVNIEKENFLPPSDVCNSFYFILFFFCLSNFCWSACFMVNYCHRKYEKVLTVLISRKSFGTTACQSVSLKCKIKTSTLQRRCTNLYFVPARCHVTCQLHCEVQIFKRLQYSSYEQAPDNCYISGCWETVTY